MCDPADTHDVLDDALALAGLGGGGWTEVDPDSARAGRAVTGDELASRLGLDCGTTRSGPDDRFAIVAWTGPRFAYVVVTTDQPARPFASESPVTILTEDLDGEFVDEDRTVFAATMADGASIVIGHVDYNLAASAKSWQAAVPVIPDEETTIDAERHGIDVLREAGARNVSVAQPPFGIEGYVQYISPTGQIGVVDVAPVDLVDPMKPRYLDGPTRTETYSGVTVRVTEYGQDAPTWARGAEAGWVCGEFAWILEPPANGTTEEMLNFVAVLVTAEQCAVSEPG